MLGWMTLGLAQLEPGSQLQFNRQSVNLMFQGEPWWSPGWGPPVTVPMGQIIRQDWEKIPPWLRPVVHNIMPMGAGATMWDDIAPTTARRAFVTIRGSEEAQYANTYSLIAAHQSFLIDQGLRDKPADFAGEIQDRTDALWMFRILAAATLPAQPTVLSPLQPMIDTYQEYQQKYKRDADAMFLQDYPQYFDYVVSLTRDPTMIDPTVAAMRNAKKYDYLFSDMRNPAMISLVTNDPKDQEFSTEVYRWEKGRPISPGSSTQFRSTQAPDDALKQRKIARGWVEYTSAKTSLDALLNQYGADSVNDPRCPTFLKTMWSMKVDQIGADNQEWQVEYGKQDNSYYGENALDLQHVISDKKFVQDHPDTGWIPLAQQYLLTRNAVNDALTARKAAGGSESIQAKSNSDLATLWAMKKKQLADMDPTWNDIDSRFFSNDNLTRFAGLEAAA